MKVDRVAWSEAGGGHRLSARVRPAGDEEFELWFKVPQPFGGDDVDATPLLVGLLPLTLALEEPLELDGCVSPRVLQALDDVMRVYTSFYPAAMRAVKVSAETAVPQPGRDTTTCFFSRGVDSWYSVLAERREPSEPGLTHLVHVHGIDVNYDERQKRLASDALRAAAGLTGLKLIECATNLRTHSDRILDWNPCHGAGLAAIALTLRPSRSLTPSGYAFGELMPAGSHPYLDYRFSTEHTAIEVHGEATRAEKVVALGDWPEALATLRVCYSGNLVGNCGDCPKCIHTMLELHVAGIDLRAAGFDRPLTPAKVASASFHPAGEGRYRETLAKLRARPGDAALAEAFTLAVLRGRVGRLAAALGDDDGWSRPDVARRVAAASAVLDAEALAPPPQTAQDGVIGLVRAVDTRRGRHVYGFGSEPEGAMRVGELGGLEAFRQESSIPVWVSRHGHLTTEPGTQPAPARPSAGRRARFLIAPLGWRGRWDKRARLAAVKQRARMMATPAPANGRAARPGHPVPVGYLHSEPAEGRRPLYAALHPVTGDQLLSSSPLEAADMGYGDGVLLGYLVARAPVGGELGVTHRPPVPWASRFGQSVRT